MPDHHYDPYDRLAPYYDLMAKVMLLPFGGERRFRNAALDVLDVQPGMRVLELGCGTGSMTAALLAMGADVTAIDLSKPMLERAERRAPEAEFIRTDMLTFVADQPYDAALLCFVMHEMTLDIRLRALEAARRACHDQGIVCVIDFADDASLLMRKGLHLYLRATEPPVAFDWLRSDFEETLAAAGLSIVRNKKLSGGTVRAVAAMAATDRETSVP
jgi:demethylmenaquinone methyltransferase/2-methoxy-6-polyprenyl-1,4-benzoquinol methylase